MSKIFSFEVFFSLFNHVPFLLIFPVFVAFFLFFFSSFILYIIFILSSWKHVFWGSILRLCMIFFYCFLNQSIPKAPFLYPLKISINLTVFWFFHGIEKGCIGNKRVNRLNTKERIRKCKTKCFYFIWTDNQHKTVKEK